MILEQLDLHFIAARLEGLEETIINRILDRAQFCANQITYQSGTIDFSTESSMSLFDLRILYQEEMDSKFGRFCAPEERPFSKNLPPVLRKVSIPDSGLHISDYSLISQSDAIKSSYLDLVTDICQPGDDKQYGSSVEHDVYALQAIARRIHYGALYVAESKYLSNPKLYNTLIENRDTKGLLEQLTRKEVEIKIIERIRTKSESLQSTINRAVRNSIDPSIISTYYQNTIIPLTKEGEIAYFLNRQQLCH
jgi:chorismate mutase